MSDPIMSDQLRAFIFQYIDSVELIDVLLFLKDRKTNWSSSIEVSRELRSNQSSISKRLELLTEIGIVEQDLNKVDSFRYSPRTEELGSNCELLLNEYKVRKHKVLELVFSTAKLAKDFANAFVISKKKRGE